MPWAIRTTLMLALISLPLQAYVSHKFIGSVVELTGWKKKTAGLIALAAVLWILLYPITLELSYLFRIEGGMRAFQRPNTLIDSLMLFPFWMGIAVITQLSIFFVILDLLFFIVPRIWKRRGVAWKRVKARVVLVLIGAMLIYVPARIYNDTWTVRLTERTLPVAGLPPALEGFHIVHISDLQADARTNGDKLQRYVDEVNRMKADVIFFSGDLVTSGTEYIDTGAQAMGKMTAQHGVYVCIGDHDIFSNRAQVVRSLQANGVNVLDDLAAVIPVQGSFVSVTGVTHAYADRATAQELATIEGQRPKGAVNIFLIHQPAEDLVSYAEQKGYELFLGGHTHGGQIVFPLPGFLLTGSSFETRFVTGFYEVGKMLVSVNNGLGMTLAPIRYHAPAEVTSIRLIRSE